jgi:outer membrane protein OmpA-like peptidoglycan-associated protein
MRRACLLVTALLWAPAQAQVTVDLQALDNLPGAKAAAKHSTAHKAKPAGKRVATKTRKPVPQEVTEKPATAPQTATATPTAPAAPAVTSPPQPAPPPATLPTAPPATVAVAPVPPPPPVQASPPPPPPILEGATSAALTTGAGLRVTFGAGEADLSPASAEAIKRVVQSAPAGDATSFNVVGYAAGAAEDPSTARRLSLSRALAVRSALMADGVASSRIYVRALGATGGTELPDRVDLAVMGANAPDAKSQSQ